MGRIFSWDLDAAIFILCKPSAFSFYCLSRTEIIRGEKDIFSIISKSLCQEFLCTPKNWSSEHFSPREVLRPYAPECHMVGRERKDEKESNSISVWGFPSPLTASTSPEQMCVGYKAATPRFNEGFSSRTVHTWLSGQLLGYIKTPL